MTMASEKTHRRLLIPEAVFVWALRLTRDCLAHVVGTYLKLFKIVVDETVPDLLDKAIPDNPQGIDVLIFGLVMIAGTVVYVALTVLFSPVLVAFVAAGFVVCLVLPSIGLGLWLVGTVMTPLAAIYPLYRKLCGVTLRCKRGNCQFRDVTLAYRCPKCGQKYTHVVPSHFGLFYHRCTCGGRIPAVRSLGRERLRKACPKCDRDWTHGKQAVPEYFVAVVGGTSVGKTCYVTMVTNALLNETGKDRPWKAELESREDEQWQEQIRSLGEGRVADPTQLGVPYALVIRLRDAEKKDRRLYIYDAAGEEYRRTKRKPHEEFVFFRDLTGIILIVDPLALPRLREQVEALPEIDLKALEVSVSNTPLSDVVRSLRRNIRRYLRYGRSGRSDVAVAVVLNKADIAIVQQRVGRDAAQRVGLSEHELVRQALISWGAGDEVLTLEDDFPHIRYSACSTLGRTADDSGQPYVADRVLPPLTWLLDGCSI